MYYSYSIEIAECDLNLKRRFEMSNLTLSAKKEHVKKLRAAGYRIRDTNLQSLAFVEVYIHGLRDSRAIEKHQEKISELLSLSPDYVELH